MVEATVDSKIIEILKNLFDNNTLGWTPNINNYGADWYYCPGCGAEHSIKGDASSPRHITHFEHADGCEIMELYSLVNKVD